MANLLQDIRYAFRKLARSPGFAAVALIALGIGIGANTAIFSVVDAVLIRPLPFNDPERLMVLWSSNREQSRDHDVSAPDFLDWRARSRSFEGMGLWYQWRQALTGFGDPQDIVTVRVSPVLFSLLGVEAILGRTFTPDEDEPGRDHVVVLSFGFWLERYGADPGAVGRRLTLDGEPYTVIGIMPPGFRFPDDDAVALWLPLSFKRYERDYRSVRMFNVVARLGPGTTLEQARAEMDGVAYQVEQENPRTNSGWGIEVVPAREVLVGRNNQLFILLGAVGFLLLIACANVANILLARAADREKEIAIRTAIGAGRFRLVRQLLVESAVLCILAGGAGLLLAIWGIDLILTLDPGRIVGWNEVGINLRVLSFTAGLSLAAAMAAGLAPALQVSKPDLNDSLKEGGGKSTVGARLKLTRGLLVVSQVALSLVLLIGAGLLINSFARVQRVDPGFNPENLLVAWLDLPDTRYPEDQHEIAFFEDLLGRVRQLPGVSSAGLVTTLPMNPVGTDYDLTFSVEGGTGLDGEAAQADFRLVSSDYFRTMGIPLLRGRDFTGRDASAIIINQTLARRFFTEGDPVGKHIVFRGGSERLEVVGVVGDVRHRGLDAGARPEMFVPVQWAPHGGMSLVVRTAADPLSLAEAVKSRVYAIDPEQPVAALTTMPNLISGSVSQRRNSMFILASFATIGLVLAAIGIYGVISYSVSRRTREIGIRMAMGACQRQVLRMIVAQGLRLAGIGLAVGLVGAFILTRLISNLLYDVSPTDPATFAAVALMLAIVSAAASYFPARRATRVDPLVALRHE